MAAVVLAVVAGGCGDDGADTESGSEADELASLAVIDTQVDINDRGGSEGDPLVVGDTVSTNSEGFGEVNYFDGSITRVAQAAEFTLTALSDEEGDRRVESSLDAGTSWNRVERLSQSDGGYVVDTPVATATAMGTAFSADCTGAPESCEFIVVEGTIGLELPDGTTIELSAPESLTVTADGPPPDPEELTAKDLAENTWITTNVELDEDAGLDPIPLDDPDGDSDEQGDAEERLDSGEPVTWVGMVSSSLKAPVNLPGDGTYPFYASFECTATTCVGVVRIPLYSLPIEATRDGDRITWVTTQLPLQPGGCEVNLTTEVVVSGGQMEGTAEDVILDLPNCQVTDEGTATISATQSDLSLEEFEAENDIRNDLSDIWGSG